MTKINEKRPGMVEKQWRENTPRQSNTHRSFNGKRAGAMS